MGALVRLVDLEDRLVRGLQVDTQDQVAGDQVSAVLADQRQETFPGLGQPVGQPSRHTRGLIRGYEEVPRKRRAVVHMDDDLDLSLGDLVGLHFGLLNRDLREIIGPPGGKGHPACPAARRA